jgi:hypothetical protein
MKTIIEVGDEVTTTPKNDDFPYEFVGIVTKVGEYITVKDQDDNYFVVDHDQVELY